MRVAGAAFEPGCIVGSTRCMSRRSSRVKGSRRTLARPGRRFRGRSRQVVADLRRRLASVPALAVSRVALAKARVRARVNPLVTSSWCVAQFNCAAMVPCRPAA